MYQIVKIVYIFFVTLRNEETCVEHQGSSRCEAGREWALDAPIEFRDKLITSHDANTIKRIYLVEY